MFDRGLKPEYVRQLQSKGLLSFLRDKAALSDDVDIHIRKNYINLYYLGQSLLKFTWTSAESFKLEVSVKYLKPEPVPWFSDRDQSGQYASLLLKVDDAAKFRADFKTYVSAVKKNIRSYGWGPEGAFEQLFISANEGSAECPTDFIILDRQIKLGGKQLDLLALSKIAGSNEYRINLIELKFSRDGRIPNVLEEQLRPYYEAFKSEYDQVVKVYEKVLQQRIAIGRCRHSADTHISRDKSTMRMIAVFGNIHENDRLVAGSLKEFKSPAYWVIQNHVLKDF